MHHCRHFQSNTYQLSACLSDGGVCPASPRPGLLAWVLICVSWISTATGRAARGSGCFNESTTFGIPRRLPYSVRFRNKSG